MLLGKVITYLLQTVVTFLVLLPLYMLLALFDYNDGIESFVGFVVQPVIGLIVSFITILTCTLIGLPIRLSRAINDWWVRKPIIPISGIVLASILITLSVLPGLSSTVTYMDGEYAITKETPNETMVITGWCLLAFAILHLYPLAFLRLRRHLPSDTTNKTYTL